MLIEKIFTSLFEDCQYMQNVKLPKNIKSRPYFHNFFICKMSMCKGYQVTLELKAGVFDKIRIDPSREGI